ncbi:TcpQ domain-containing protein [Pantoea agglomerans]
MSFTERAGLIPVLLLTGCASPAVITGPPSGSVVDGMLSRSAADISAMQYRIHQSGPSAARPVSPSAVKKPLPTGPGGTFAASGKAPVVAAPSPASGAGPADGFVQRDGAAPTLRAAMRDIVPKGQTVVFDKAVSADAPALWRWTGNDRWQYVAGKMLATHGLKATINVKANTVTVEPAQRAQTAHSAGQSATLPLAAGIPGNTLPAGAIQAAPGLAAGRNPFRGEKPAAGTVITASSTAKLPVQPAPVVRVWKIERGTTLRQGYELWASQEVCPPGKPKWTVRWDTGTNYPIDYTLTFRAANFEDATAQLFSLWHRAQVPLFVSGYRQQCLVVISDVPPNPSPQSSQQE